MPGKTEISWATDTWNLVYGCDKVGPGCAHCYIPTAAPLRIAHMEFDGKGHMPLVLHEDRLEVPFKWKRPRRIFVNSLSDFFHEDIPLEFTQRAWDVMVRAHWHQFLILTKRPERIASTLGPNGIGFYAVEGPVPRPQPNIWIGCTVENRRVVNRVDHLRDAPAAIRFLSCEPLLGPLVKTVRREHEMATVDGVDYRIEDTVPSIAERIWMKSSMEWQDGKPLPELDLRRIHWAIIGGESGHRARPMRIEWVRDLIRACHDESVPVHMKQMGSVWAHEHGLHGKGRGKGQDPMDWPVDLRVREWPIATGMPPEVLSDEPAAHGMLF